MSDRELLQRFTDLGNALRAEMPDGTSPSAATVADLSPEEQAFVAELLRRFVAASPAHGDAAPRDDEGREFVPYTRDDLTSLRAAYPATDPLGRAARTALQLLDAAVQEDPRLWNLCEAVGRVLVAAGRQPGGYPAPITAVAELDSWTADLESSPASRREVSLPPMGNLVDKIDEASTALSRLIIGLHNGHTFSTEEISTLGTDALYRLNNAALDAVTGWNHSLGAHLDAQREELKDWLATRSAPVHGDAGRECVWTVDEDGQYDTGCGGKWFFDSGTPAENKARFCIYCGAPLVDAARLAADAGTTPAGRRPSSQEEGNV